MGTAATATIVEGMGPGTDFAGIYKAIYTVLLADTDASGQQTLDLTADFSKVASITLGGSLAATGYFIEVEKPSPTTAITATNIKLSFYEAGADGAALDAVASTPLAAVITGLTIEVSGKSA